MSVSCEISIIIPCFNRGEKLTRAVASIPSACSVPHETILIDDCPQASGFSTAKEYGARYFYKAELEQGVSNSRNIGVTLARGRYLAFLDDDDFFQASGLDFLYQALSRGVGFSYGNYACLHPQKSVSRSLGGLTRDDLLVSNQIPVGSYLIEKSMVKYPFDERLKSHEDWDFILGNVEWSRSCHVDREIVVIDKTENRTTSREAGRRNKFWLDFLSLYAKYPAPHLLPQRKQKLLEVGVNVGNLDIDN